MPKDKEISVIRVMGNKKKESAKCDESSFQISNTMSGAGLNKAVVWGTEIFNNTLCTKKGKSMN